MKLLRKSIDALGAGDITLRPELSEDIWAAYNLVSTGDRVTCSTFRKVQKVGATGTTSNTTITPTHPLHFFRHKSLKNLIIFLEKQQKV